MESPLGIAYALPQVSYPRGKNLPVNLSDGLTQAVGCILYCHYSGEIRRATHRSRPIVRTIIASPEVTLS